MRTTSPAPTPLDIRIGMKARQIREVRRRSLLRSLGRRSAVAFIALFGGLGSYYALTTPGIPRLHAFLFVLLNAAALVALRGAGRRRILRSLLAKTRRPGS